MAKPNQTTRRKKTNRSSIDRLSDEIILHILSFLPTKISVSTSILARRWRFLWARVPNLHIVYNRRELGIDTIYTKILLHYRVKDMNIFRLHSDDEDCSRPHLQACIEYAIDRNVRQIDLRLHFPNCFPSPIFACRTVVDLKLSGHGNIPSTNICLPALKKLYLAHIRYESPESLPHLLSVCPVLEELTIHRLSTDVACLVVSSSTINRLDINTRFVNNTDTRFTLKIDAPAVRYLMVRDVVSNEVSAGQLASLIEADVCLDKPKQVEGDDVLYGHSVLEFVVRLSNVKYLKFTTRWMDVSDYEFSTWSVKFHNLIKLELRSDWRFISNFLENADNLEVLVICGDDEDLKHWIEPKEVPACLLSHLGIVRIFSFGCEDQEFHMIRYILRNSKVLKKMEIHFECDVIDLEEKYEALKRISLFTRGSGVCELHYY